MVSPEFSQGRRQRIDGCNNALCRTDSWFHRLGVHSIWEKTKEPHSSYFWSGVVRYTLFYIKYNASRRGGHCAHGIAISHKILTEIPHLIKGEAIHGHRASSAWCLRVHGQRLIKRSVGCSEEKTGAKEERRRAQSSMVCPVSPNLLPYLIVAGPYACVVMISIHFNPS